MKIFLAGIENGDSKEVVNTGVIDNGFVSYYYEKRKKIPGMPNYRKLVRKIIVDSGAHSFFSESDTIHTASIVKKKIKTKQSPEAYFEDYKKWLVFNYDNFDYFVELDIGELVGQEKVLRWREELKELGLYNKCITVYHPKVMSGADWLATLDDSQSKYVALEGVRGGCWTLPYFKLIKECYDRGIKVHGFAMTKNDVYYSYPFYSVDSSSWKSGSLYGNGKVLVNKEIKNVKFKNKEHCFNVVDNKNFKISNLHSKNKKILALSRYLLAVEAYKKIETEATRIWEKRGIIWKD